MVLLFEPVCRMDLSDENETKLTAAMLLAIASTWLDPEYSPRWFPETSILGLYSAFKIEGGKGNMSINELLGGPELPPLMSSLNVSLAPFSTIDSVSGIIMEGMAVAMAVAPALTR